MKVLVTGATGNVGREVVRQLLDNGQDVFAGTREGKNPVEPNATPVSIDFEKPVDLSQKFDAIFLMRPPHIANADVFAEFLDKIDRKTRIVFLSVEGADKKSYLPHAKIEKKIEIAGFEHVFVRPSYFMDNLLTTLWPELKKNKRIYLPAGGLRLDWVSARDIASVCVAALTGQVAESAVTVCSGARTGFAGVCSIINKITGTQLSYKPAGLFGFIQYSRSQRSPWSYIAVMLLLHFLPRFERAKQKPCAQASLLLGRDVESLEMFVARNKARFSELM